MKIAEKRIYAVDLTDEEKKAVETLKNMDLTCDGVNCGNCPLYVSFGGSNNCFRTYLELALNAIIRGKSDDNT